MQFQIESSKSISRTLAGHFFGNTPSLIVTLQRQLPFIDRFYARDIKVVWDLKVVFINVKYKNGK